MNEKKEYWLHRISHEAEIAYPLLLEKNLLSIGWKALANSETIRIFRDLPEGEREQHFRKMTEAKGITSRSRWNLWYFFQMKPDDIVLVPMFSGDFALYRVLEAACPVQDLKGLTLSLDNKEQVSFTETGAYYQNPEEEADLGFVIKVEPLKERSPRTLVDDTLVSRMKIRIATANISDLADEVEKARVATVPPDLHDSLQELLTRDSIDSFYRAVKPEQFEELIRCYLKQMGADRVRIPAKNEAGKEAGADADVIAEFDDLKINIYVQAKKHEGTSNNIAVNQILKYNNSADADANEINHILWAVTTAEFDDSAKIAAQGKVRLIGGREFMSMLLNAGLQNMKNELR